MILIDTSVLSAALRYRSVGPSTEADVELLRQMLAARTAPTVPGIVIQEILSGIKAEGQFAKLQSKLEGFPVALAQVSDHVSAASLLNTCRRHGIAATMVDCLIAAQCISNRARLWTLDRDFLQIARHGDLMLFRPGEPATSN